MGGRSEELEPAEEYSAEERRVLDERIAELRARGVKFATEEESERYLARRDDVKAALFSGDSSELDEAAEYMSRRDAIESGEATWKPGAVLRSRCYECGHLLAREANFCPWCCTEFDDREWPATVLWSCECRRCTEAKGGDASIAVRNEGEQ